MRTRIALVAVFAVATIIAISSAVLVPPVSSQAASTAIPRSSTPIVSIPSATQLVGFDSPRSSGSHPATVSGLGALLSLGTRNLAAANTAVAPVAAAPAPVATPVAVVTPTPAPAPVPAPTPAPVATPVADTTSNSNTDGAYAAWSRVADCEEGGWIGYASPQFPDSLGINSANWYANGGGSDVSPAAQIAVAQRIEGTGYVPDQDGCSSW